MTAPPTTSEWPLRYFVVEWTTSVAPSVERPLEHRASRTCCRPRAGRRVARATSAMAAMSKILSIGLVGVSIQTRRVFGRIALATRARIAHVEERRLDARTASSTLSKMRNVPP